MYVKSNTHHHLRRKAAVKDSEAFRTSVPFGLDKHLNEEAASE
jgi:hypothetical protein